MNKSERLVLIEAENDMRPVCMSVCVCIHKGEKDREKERERERDRIRNKMRKEAKATQIWINK